MVLGKVQGLQKQSGSSRHRILAFLAVCNQHEGGNTPAVMPYTLKRDYLRLSAITYQSCGLEKRDRPVGLSLLLSFVSEKELGKNRGFSLLFSKYCFNFTDYI